MTNHAELILEGDVITAEMLNDYGIDCREVRRLWPHAVERVTLDGKVCWLRTEIEGETMKSAWDER